MINYKIHSFIVMLNFHINFEHENYKIRIVIVTQLSFGTEKKEHPNPAKFSKKIRFKQHFFKINLINYKINIFIVMLNFHIYFEHEIYKISIVIVIQLSFRTEK